MTMYDYTGEIEEKSMLVEFRVKNYGCFRDEQVLSFVPVREKSLFVSKIMVAFGMSRY